MKNEVQHVQENNKTADKRCGAQEMVKLKRGEFLCTFTFDSRLRSVPTPTPVDCGTCEQAPNV